MSLARALSLLTASDAAKRFRELTFPVAAHRAAEPQRLGGGGGRFKGPEMAMVTIKGGDGVRCPTHGSDAGRGTSLFAV